MEPGLERHATPPIEAVDSIPIMQTAFDSPITIDPYDKDVRAAIFDSEIVSRLPLFTTNGCAIL